jgi:SAM-dependent methyltransferase
MNLRLSIICPLCSSIQGSSEETITYPGSFLSCSQIIHCANCDLFFATPIPPEDKLADYYESGTFWNRFANPFGPEQIDFSLRAARSRLRLLASRINLTKSSKNIDIGAGNGQFGYALQELNLALTYDIVEPDQNITKQLGKFVTNCFARIDQVENCSYDLAIINHVLEHVPDPSTFLRSIVNLLNPTGNIFIEVPFLDFKFKESVEPHLLFWTPKSLSFLLAECNLYALCFTTAGMPHRAAKHFFQKMSLVEKSFDPWCYKGKLNKLVNKLGGKEPFDMLKRFQFDSYGGDRMWLRCIAQKVP